MKAVLCLLVFFIHQISEAQPLRSTRGETEFPHAGERSVENEFPEEPSPLRKPAPRPEPVVELGRRLPDEPETAARSDRFMSARVNPFTSLLGLIYADAGIAIADQFLIGPSLRIANYNLFFVKEESLGIGARAAWYAQGPFKHSFYVATTPLYSWGRVSSRAFSATAEAKFNRFYLDVIGGYQWHWSSFNLGLGAGLAYNGVSLSELKGEAGDLKGDIPTFGFTSAAGILPTAEFTIGWSF